MHTRTIGGLLEPCPVIGFGGWGIGGATPGATSYGDIDDTAAHSCIDAALMAGMRFFDTSPAYGYGLSEARLGRALLGKRDEVIIATKGGLERYDEPPNFSPAALATGLDASLGRLGTDHVDIFQLHNPPVDVMTAHPGLAAFSDGLKESGKATTIGISVKAPDEAMALLAKYPFETVQVNLNMLDVRACTSGLLDHCAARGISVLARTPLCFGFLSLAIDATSSFDDADHRGHWSEVQRRVWSDGAVAAQAIAARHDPADATPAARALRFCLLHPAVKVVLTGPMTAGEARENAAAGSLPPLGSACLDDIAELNARKSFFVRD